MPVTRTPLQERKLMGVLNEARVILQAAIARVESYVDFNNRDISELEIKDAVWSCDDKLALTFELDKEPTELELQLQFEDYNKMLKELGLEQYT